MLRFSCVIEPVAWSVRVSWVLRVCVCVCVCVLNPLALRKTRWGEYLSDVFLMLLVVLLDVDVRRGVDGEGCCVDGCWYVDVVGEYEATESFSSCCHTKNTGGWLFGSWFSGEELVVYVLSIVCWLFRESSVILFMFFFSADLHNLEKLGCGKVILIALYHLP